MKGYKVVNYKHWTSIPDIFTKLKKAREEKEKWEFGKDAVIEYFNSNNGKYKQFRD